MKKTFILILIIIILAIAFWLVLPFFIDKEVSEISPLAKDNPSTETSDILMEENQVKLVASGSFSGFDKIHYGSGTASLIKNATEYVIRFEEDFNVANGPDLYVGLGKDGRYIKGSEISKLKGNKGSQNYILPKDFNLETANEVWVWCKAFSVPFAKATLITQ